MSANRVERSVPEKSMRGCDVVGAVSTVCGIVPSSSAQTASGTRHATPPPRSAVNGFSGSGRVPFEPVNSLDLDQRATFDARLTKIIPFTERMKLFLSFEAFNVMNHTYLTNRIPQKYVLANLVLTPNARFSEGRASQGFPDGTNARRAQVSARFVW